MIFEIDFDSDEAFYMQLRNQVIVGIATRQVKEGDSLPSVRQLAGDIGINMHTVNKAYSILKEEGFLTLNRKMGAVIALAQNKSQTVEEIQNILQVILAQASCKDVSREEIHRIVDDIYDSYF